MRWTTFPTFQHNQTLLWTPLELHFPLFLFCRILEKLSKNLDIFLWKKKNLLVKSSPLNWLPRYFYQFHKFPTWSDPTPCPDFSLSFLSQTQHLSAWSSLWVPMTHLIPPLTTPASLMAELALKKSIKSDPNSKLIFTLFSRSLLSPKSSSSSLPSWSFSLWLALVSPWWVVIWAILHLFSSVSLPELSVSLALAFFIKSELKVSPQNAKLPPKESLINTMFPSLPEVLDGSYPLISLYGLNFIRIIFGTKMLVDSNLSTCHQICTNNLNLNTKIVTLTKLKI